jgi:multidrug efflux pump subunit AcrA (membrane-fusion protein)
MRDRRVAAAGAALVLTILGAAWAQGPGRGTQSPPVAAPTSARVETAPLEPIPPDKFQVPTVLEPSRRVTLVATEDGVVQGLAAQVGDTVRERQDLVLLDRTEAAARLKIARAAVKESQAALKAAREPAEKEKTAAQIEAAEARAELAQLALDRCSLKAPFAGMVLAYPVSVGQFVPKGTTVAELADTTSLRVLVPVDRTKVKEGQTLQLVSEGKPVTGKVQAVLPLPETFAPLRELATPWSAAWVVIENPSTAGLEPGQRVRNPFLPAAPIASIPARGVMAASSETPASGAGGSVVQVVRNDHVANVPVVVLGEVGPERLQVAGAFRQGDVAIVESSVPLAAGTYLRFGSQEAAVQGTPPDPNAVGAAAEVEPAAPAPAPAASRVAPIGAPDSAVPKTTARPPAASKPATKPSRPQPKAVAPAPF